MKTNNLCTKEGCNSERYSYKASGGRVGYDRHCSQHKNERSRNWYAANPGKKAEHVRTSFANCEGFTYLHKSSGYMMRLGVEHPASAPSGITPLHRIILWDKLNGQNVPCAECGGELVWFSADTSNQLCVDHVDGVKTNNDPANLEPVHNACNVKRAFKLRAKQASDAA